MIKSDLIGFWKWLVVVKNSIEIKMKKIFNRMEKRDKIVFFCILKENVSESIYNSRLH